MTDTATVEWLRSDADHTLRYAPMLKSVLLRQSPPGERRAIAKAYRAFAEEQLAKLRRADATPRTERDPNARRLAIQFYEAVENWARETAEK